GPRERHRTPAALTQAPCAGCRPRSRVAYPIEYGMMRNQMLRRAIVQLLYERALEVPQSLIVGIEAREVVLQLGMTNKEFAFNALYLDGKGLITNDRGSNGGELQFNAIMITPAGIDVIENPTDFDRLSPITEYNRAHIHRIQSNL